MLSLVCCLALAGPIAPVESPDFPAAAQTTAVSATVRVLNATRSIEGSGVILGRKGDFVYILTARHVVDKADRLEINTYSPASYPKPDKVYRSARVVAVSTEIRDLALVRLTTSDAMPATLSLCPTRLLPADNRFSALSVGCGEGGAPTCLIDEVNGKKQARREAESAAFWEVKREQQKGRSGGPLIDKRGYLIGVCSGTNEGQSYFCHAEEVRAFLDQNGFDWLK